MANNLHGKDEGLFLRSANAGCLQGVGCMQVCLIGFGVLWLIVYITNMFK